MCTGTLVHYELTIRFRWNGDGVCAPYLHRCGAASRNTAAISSIASVCHRLAAILASPTPRMSMEPPEPRAGQTLLATSQDAT